MMQKFGSCEAEMFGFRCCLILEDTKKEGIEREKRRRERNALAEH